MLILSSSFLLLLCFSHAEQLNQPHGLTAREWLEGIMTPLGAPSKQEMECLGSDDLFEQTKEIVQVLVKRTWPKNTVPYMLDASLLSGDRLVVAKAMHIIQSVSCIRFVPYLQHKHPLWVNISRNCPCNPYKASCDFIGAFANIGPLPGGRLVISGACLHPSDPKSVRLITHELFHSLGILHHHERVDRDLYIKINWLNIRLFSLLNFKWNPFYLPQGIPYDCQSIMHYKEDAFAKRRGVPTITARDPESCNLTCPSFRPTQADVDLLRIKYNCPKPSKYKQKYKRIP